MSTINVNYAAEVTVRETLTENVPAANDPTIIHSGFNTDATLNATSTPAPATKLAAMDVTLVAGAATLDLTNLLGTNDIAVNGAGLKVQILRILNPASNSHVLLVKAGASNGYALRGAGWQEMLDPGEEMTWKGCDHANVPDIDNTHKVISLTDNGANGTDMHQVLIVMG